MAMSRKHYRAMAEIIHDARNDISSGNFEAKAVMEEMTSRVAEFFAADNSNFNFQRFYDACRPEVRK